jgi:hypothetical protein
MMSWLLLRHLMWRTRLFLAVKVGGRPCGDVLRDSFFQFMLGMRIQPSLICKLRIWKNYWRKWPVRLWTFTKNHNFIELRLTENAEFKDTLMKCHEHGYQKKKSTVHSVQ